MHQSTTAQSPLTIGLDLGSKSTQCAVYAPDHSRVEERKIRMDRSGVAEFLRRFSGARVVMEASTSTRWVAEIATDLGHEVVVANPRCIPVITASVSKCDRNDARLLAKLGQVQPSLLNPVQLREDRYQSVRTLLSARQQLVRQRTALVTFIRSEVRVLGSSLPSCGTKVFAKKCRPLIPTHLREALASVLDSIQLLCDAIDDYDATIEGMCEREFPETKLLRQVHGVGPLIALAYVATIADPHRFRRPRAVGAYLGLVPRSSQSGNSNPALSITKCGDRMMRSLLVSAATRILGPHGTDSTLRRFGERIAERGGKTAKARARIAVARKLAVLLHSLLRSGEVYEPLRGIEPAPIEAA